MVYMYHSFLSHSSADGHLGCFHVLAIINSAAMMRQVLGPGALGRPRGIGWRWRWEEGLGWGIHVNPWLIHVNVWQKPLQYCKVISLQLIKKKKSQFLSMVFKVLNHLVSLWPLLLHFQPDFPPLSDLHLYWLFLEHAKHGPSPSLHSCCALCLEHCHQHYQIACFP